MDTVNPQNDSLWQIRSWFYSATLALGMLLFISSVATAATVTLRPDGVSAAGSWTGVTAVNLNDQSDTTYAQMTGATVSSFEVTMQNSAAYAGATINSIDVFVRGTISTGSGGGERVDFGPTAVSGTSVTMTRTTYNDYSKNFTGPYTTTDIDNLTIAVSDATLGAGEVMRISDVWVVVNYTVSNSAPTLSIAQPDGVGDSVGVGTAYSVTYTLADSDDIVTAAFYYDTDNTGLNGTSLLGACATAAEGTGVTCSWDTTGMTPGSYYVYGLVSDGVNPQVSAYSTGMLTITATNSCANCHGDPPVDSATRDAVAGTFAGSHNKHSSYACDSCHATLPTVSGHRDGKIGFKGTVGPAGDDGKYVATPGGAAQTSITQTNIPALGSCDTVNCHGNNNTGTWGTAYGSCTTTTCHGFPPATNAHTAHYTAKGWATGDYAFCVACHPNDFASHTDRTDGAVSLANVTPSGSGTTTTCSSISATGCHNGAATTPTWGSTNITCSNCHTVDGTNSATVANPVSGLHSNTVASVQDHDATLGCEACHVKASISGHWDGAASATADYTKAQVGITSVMYTDASGTAATRGTCMGTTELSACHTDKGNWRRAWSTDADVDIAVSKLPGQAVCNVCHGQYSGIGSSTGWNEGTSHYRSSDLADPRTENKGIIHADAGDECEDCHGYDSVAVHNSNNKIDFSDSGNPSGYAVTLNATPNPDVWYCANCHNLQNAQVATLTASHTFLDSLAFPNSTNPINHVVGTQTPQGSCFGCHGDTVAAYWPNTDGTNDGVTSPNDAGVHKLHMAWLAKQVYSETLTTLLTDNGNGTSDTKQRALCDYCHQASTNDGDHMSTTLADVFPSVTYAKRIQDGTSDTGTLAAFDTGTKVCSNVDCHAQYGTALAGSEPVATPSWYVAPTHTVALGSLPTTMNCAACHNSPTADPNHTEHTGANTLFGISVTCARCHSNGPVWGTPTGTLPTAGHLDGTFNLVGSASLTYAGTFRTSFGGCSTNVCHNNGTSTTTGTPNASTYKWGDTITNCTECHLGAMTSNAHLEHSTASGYTSAPCTDCHALETASTHIDSNLNFNTAKVTYSTATAGVVAGLRANASQAGTCLTSGCHNKAATQSAAWNTAGFLTCNSCHGDATSGLSAAHADHITAGKTCSQCHADPITDATHISVKTTLIDGATTATGEAAVPFSNAAALTKYTYNPTEHSCYTPTGATPLGIGCHATAGYTGVTDATRPDWDTTIAATACTACHTNTTTANLNPTRGLHKAGTLTSSTPHDDAFGVGGTCTTCHTAMPALGAAHINGTFTLDEATATNEYYTLATMYTDAAVNSGTCSGATAGAANCHDSVFDAGSWARKWSATAYNVDGTQCANCHGGFNNDWTFGSAANTTDFAVSHTYDWNPAAESYNIIGNHRNSTGFPTPTMCNDCHVYTDAPYSLTWGTGNHGNNLITMNSTVGYNSTTFGCTNTCHTDNTTGHTMESSANVAAGSRVQTIAGPAMSCSTCHSTITTHTDADGAGTTYTSGNCSDCHPAHTTGLLSRSGTSTANNIFVSTIYGRTVNASTADTGTPIPTMDNQYASHDSYIMLGGNAILGACNTKSTEAEWCWACHDAQTTKVTEWRTNTQSATGNSPYDYGRLYADASTVPGTETSNWTTGYWRSGKGLNSTLTTNPFWYKRGKVRSTHSASYDATTATSDSTKTWKGSLVNTTSGYSTTYNKGENLDAVGSIRCTYCHDVHGTHDGIKGDPNPSGQPYLRGTWIGNLYPEDGAPRYGMTTFTNQIANATATIAYGVVPRGSADPANTGLSGVTQVGGFWIDQNSNNPTGSITGATALDKASNSSGLCEQCHGANKNGTWTAAAIGALDQITGEALWVSGGNGHANAVVGAAGVTTTAANIFTRTLRGAAALDGASASTGKDSVDMGLASQTGYGTSYRMSTSETSGYRWKPWVANSTEAGATISRSYAYRGFAWNTSYQTSTRNFNIATGTAELAVAAAAPTTTPPATETAHNSQANYHTFTCSKCHNPHASRLPKLMITNCLDTNHNTWEDKNTFTQGQTGSPVIGTPWSGLRHSQWASAQNCHRLDARATNAGTTTVGTGWNKVTPWIEDTAPNPASGSGKTTDLTTLPAY